MHDAETPSPAAIPAGRVRVVRPLLLAGLALVAAAAFAAAVAGLWAAQARRPVPAPVMLAGAPPEAEAMALALDAAPWISSAPSAAAGDGLVVWLVAPLTCAACASTHQQVADALAAQGEVRVIAFPDPAAPEDHQAAAAALAQARAWALYRQFAAQGAAPLAQAAPKDAADREGFAYWARAAAEKLAPFGVPLEGPALIWRAPGGGYRAIYGADAADPKAALAATALDRANGKP